MRKHSDRSHALLSASGSTRWLNCTPSPRLEEQYPDRSSIYAEEGTLAHELSEAELRKSFKIITAKQRDAEVKKIKTHKLYNREMPRQVKKYTDIVLERYAELKAEYGRSITVSIEERLDYAKYAPEGFGTGDAILASPGTLDMFDLKYGKGVEVSAVDNDQLKLYALGAYEKYHLLYDIEQVHLHVVQPRINNFSTWSISTYDLLTWAHEVVKPTAAIAFKGEGRPTAGDWCRWCRAKATCRAFANMHLELAKLEFAKPALLTDTEVLEVYSKLDTLTTWVNAVKDYVFTEAVKGKKWRGLKLVVGRSNRKWKDEDKVIAALTSSGFDLEEITNTKLKGIGDISNLLSVDEFETLLQPLVTKPLGSPTLVHESDKREPFGLAQAKIEFAPTLEDDPLY